MPTIQYVGRLAGQPACDMARFRECEKSEARNNGSNRYIAHGTIISD